MAIVKRVRADGTPAYRVVVHTPAQGHQSMGTFDRKKDAELAEREYKRRAALSGVAFVPKALPYSELSKAWLISLRIKPNSIRAISWRLDQSVSHFGRKPITRITKQDCEDFLTAILDKGMANVSAKYCLATLKRVFVYGIDCGYMKVNPARTVKPPQLPKSTKMQLLAPADHQRLVEAVDAHWSTLAYVWAFVGLRASEIQALTWLDIDLRLNTLTVRNQVTRDGTLSPELKSSAAYRTVHFSREVGTRLAEWHRVCPTHNKSDWVFPDEHGDMLRYSRLNRVFIGQIKERCGMPDFTSHDFRHTNASWLIAQGADVKYIQRHLGHEKAATTLDTYGHMMSHEHYGYMEALGAWYVDATLPRDEEAQVTAITHIS